jgi:hypothetical protein
MKTNQAVRSIRDHGGFSWVNNSIYEGFFSHLGPHGIAVYIALAKYADGKTQECYPSKNRIADDVGMSSRQVSREIKKLEKLKLISKKTRTKPGSQAPTSNLYTLTAPPYQDDDKGLPTDSQVPFEGGTDCHTSVCPTVLDSMPDSHLDDDWLAPKQQVATHNQKNTFIPTTRSSPPSQASPSRDADVAVSEFPDSLEILLKQLNISARGTRQMILRHYKEDGRRVINWALVLASPQYCEDHDIRSPSGFFLAMLKDHHDSPVLEPLSSEGACKFCGDTGAIDILGARGAGRRKTICGCPVCGEEALFLPSNL